MGIARAGRLVRIGRHRMSYSYRSSPCIHMPLAMRPSQSTSTSLVVARCVPWRGAQPVDARVEQAGIGKLQRVLARSALITSRLETQRPCRSWSSMRAGAALASSE